MNYVCENYEINEEKAADRSKVFAEYAKKLQRGTEKEKEKEKNA